MKERRVKRLSSKTALREHGRREKRFEFIARRLRNVNIEEVWRKLEDDLTLGDGRESYDRILRGLDEAEANLRRAGMLLQVAIEELDEFDVHWREAYFGWSKRARTKLEEDKREKRASGQVTLDAIENWVAANVTEYREWRSTRRGLERNKNLCKQMFSAWESRSATLRKQADLVERRRGISTELLPRRGE